MRGRVALQVAEPALSRTFPLARIERELAASAAVTVERANRGHGARTGLEHGHPLDAAVVEEPLVIPSFEQGWWS